MTAMEELERWQEGFLQHCDLVRGLQANTVAAYRIDLRLWLAYLHSRAELDRVAAAFAPASMMAFVGWLRAERKNGTRAVQRKLATLSALLDYLLLMEVLHPTDDRRRELPRLGRPRQPLPNVVDEGAMERLLGTPDPATLLGARDRAILLLLYSTGLRVSELCALTDRDFDRDPGQVRIVGKGQRERVVPVRPEARAAVEAYRKRRPEPGERAKGALFISRKGGPLTVRGVEFLVHRHAAAAGIGDRITPHTLRHSCATHLVRQGVALEVVRRLLGHQSLATTQVYLHLTVEDIRHSLALHPCCEMWAQLQMSLSIPVEKTPANLARAG